MNTDVRQPLLEGIAGWINVAGEVFGKRAYLIATTMMLLAGLVIALLPIAYGYLRTPGQVTSTSQSRGGEGAAATPCDRVLVSFSRAATMAQVGALLDRLGASILYGPNENGAYEVRVRPESVEAVISTLEKEEGVVIAASRMGRCS